MIARAAVLLFAFAASTATAQELYQAEILIFAQPTEEVPAAIAQANPQLDVPATDNIDFARYPCLPLDGDPQMPPKLRTREDLALCLSGYLRLNELDGLMVQDRLLLAQSEDFRILHHSAWRQPGQSTARAVRITPLIADKDTTETLSGTVRVTKGQYLQVDFELAYRAPGTDPEIAPAILRKSQTVRANQTYYLDDARIGILVRISEIEDPETEEIPVS